MQTILISQWRSKCFECFVRCFAFHDNSVVIEWNDRFADVCSTFDLGVQILVDRKHGVKKSFSIVLPWANIEV